MRTLLIIVVILFSSLCLAATASNPCPIKADIWVLAGQSNMQGFAVLREQAKPDPRIMLFNMNNKWIVAQEPVHRIWEASAPVHRRMALACGYKEEDIRKFEEESKTHPVGGVGPGLFFAQHLVANGINAVGLVASAHGGTSMDQWSPALKDKGDESLYGAMINRINAVGKIKGVLWYQGESDTDEVHGPQYEQKMLNFIDSLRKDVNDANLPFLYVQIGRYRCNDLPASKGLAMEQVRESERRLMSLRKNVYMVTGIDLPLDDVIHISFEGQKRLGRRLAEVALTNVYRKAGHGTSIDIASIESFKDPSPYLRVRFKGVNGKLIAAGRPADFDLFTPVPADAYIIPYRTEFDPNDPSALIVRLQKAPTSNTKLFYGRGSVPYLNIVDEKDMAIPAFGPVDISATK